MVAVAVLTFDTTYWANIGVMGGVKSAAVSGGDLVDMAPFLFFSGKSEYVCLIRKTGINFRIIRYPFTVEEEEIKSKLNEHGGISALAKAVGISSKCPQALVDVDTGFLVEATSFESSTPNNDGHPLFISAKDSNVTKGLDVRTIRGDFDTEMGSYILTTLSYSSQYLDGPWRTDKVSSFARDVIARVVHEHLKLPLPKIKRAAVYATIKCRDFDEDNRREKEFNMERVISLLNKGKKLEKSDDKKPPLLASELALVFYDSAIEQLRNEDALPHQLVPDIMPKLIEGIVIFKSGNIMVRLKNQDTTVLSYLRRLWKVPESVKMSIKAGSTIVDNEGGTE